MSDEMTNREYWAEVSSLAESIQEETRDDMDGVFDCDWTRDEYEEALRERLHETIDGHQWVIYTAYNYEVLRHSDNDGYMVEEFGADNLAPDGVLNTNALAFWALYADVSEYIERHPLDLDPEAVEAASDEG